MSARGRRWKWALVAVLLLAGVPAALFLYRAHLGRMDLERLLAELDATEPGWRSAGDDSERPGLPNEQDSAVLIAKVRPALAPAYKALAALDSSYPDLFDRLPPQTRMRVEGRQALREALGSAPAAVDESLRLQHLPRGRHPIRLAPDIVSTLMGHLQDVRDVQYILQWLAALRAEDEDLPGALAACRALLYAGRSIGTEPFVVSQLVRGGGQRRFVAVLERTLGQGEVSDSELQTMQQLLETEIQENLFLHAWRGERGHCLAVLDAIATGKVSMSSLANVRASSNWIKPLLDYMPLTSAGQAGYLRFVNRMVEISALPVHQQSEPLAELDRGLGQQPLLVQLLAHPIIRMAMKCPQAQQQAALRSALLAVAAERYRLRHGRWPELQQDLLEAGLLREAVSDPCDGQPLRWRLLSDGAVAYSVGANRIDEQGSIERDKQTSGDIGFRLWHPDLRRQPAD